jgi:hypothetical protein
MRGKLRDKRPTTQRDNFKRDLMVERRRQPRRENRSINWQDQQVDAEDYLEEDIQVMLLEPTPAK